MAVPTEHDELVPLYDGPVGSVFAGIESATGAAFALKVYPGKLDRHTRSELDSELGQLTALRADAAVLVADSVEEFSDGRCAVRMELCAQSLPELITSFGPLSVSDTLVLGAALAQALAAAHRAGLLHGGVTPGNVLFRPQGEPVLSDFGLTLRRAFPRDSAKDVDYLPPETVRDGTVDVRSDVYGLGGILYLALSGQSPHHGQWGEQPQQRLLRVLGAPAPEVRRDDAPAGLKRLVARLLDKDPEQRPADAAKLANELTAMQYGSTVAVPLPEQPATTELSAGDDSPHGGPGFFDLSGFGGASEVTVRDVPAAHREPAEQGEPADPDEELDDFDDDLEEEIDEVAEPQRQPFIPPPPMHWPPVPPDPPAPPSSARPVLPVAPQPHQGGPPPVPPRPHPQAPQPQAAQPVAAQPGPPPRPPAPQAPPAQQAPPTQPVPVPPPVAQLPPIRPFPAPNQPGPHGRPGQPGRPMPGHPQAVPPEVPLPSLGEPILVYGSERKRAKRINRNVLLLGGCGVLLAAFVVGGVVLLNQQRTLALPPQQAPVGAPTQPVPAPKGATPQLNDPVDEGNFVRLSWRSTAKLDFAVVVAAEGRPARALFVHHEKSLRVQVDPVRKYCFLVQGTDGDHIYESDPKPIRGAKCTK